MGAKIVGFITAGVAIALNIFFFQSLIDENNNPESYVYILIGGLNICFGFYDSNCCILS